MLDKLISIAAMGDALTPLLTFLQDLRNRPSVGYNISVDSGWNAYLVRDLLQGGGVAIWGLTVYHNEITFRTRKSQAIYAQYLMERAGVPYVGGIERYVAPKAQASEAIRAQKQPSEGTLTTTAREFNHLIDRLSNL